MMGNQNIFSNTFFKLLVQFSELSSRSQRLSIESTGHGRAYVRGSGYAFKEARDCLIRECKWYYFIKKIGPHDENFCIKITITN